MLTEGELRVIKALHDRRAELRMSQAALADRSGISLPTINNLENARTRPTPRTMVAVEKALGWRAGTLEAIRAGGAPPVDESPVLDQWQDGYDRGFEDGWRAALIKVQQSARLMARNPGVPGETEKSA